MATSALPKVVGDTERNFCVRGQSDVESPLIPKKLTASADFMAKLPNMVASVSPKVVGDTERNSCVRRQ